MTKNRATKSSILLVKNLKFKTWTFGVDQNMFAGIDTNTCWCWPKQSPKTYSCWWVWCWILYTALAILTLWVVLHLLCRLSLNFVMYWWQHTNQPYYHTCQTQNLQIQFKHLYLASEDIEDRPKMYIYKAVWGVIYVIFIGTSFV